MELELTNKLKSAIVILQEKIATQLHMSMEDVRNLQVRIDDEKVMVYAKEKVEPVQVEEPITDYV